MQFLLLVVLGLFVFDYTAVPFCCVCIIAANVAWHGYPNWCKFLYKLDLVFLLFWWWVFMIEVHLKLRKE